MSMSTRCQDGCPAVEKLASLQQALSLPIFQAVEIVPRCAAPSSSFLLFRVTWTG